MFRETRKWCNNNSTNCFCGGLQEAHRLLVRVGKEWRMCWIQLQGSSTCLRTVPDDLHQSLAHCRMYLLWSMHIELVMLTTFNHTLWHSGVPKCTCNWCQNWDSILWAEVKCTQNTKCPIAFLLRPWTGCTGEIFWFLRKSWIFGISPALDYYGSVSAIFGSVTRGPSVPENSPI